jgi:galactonate dehydratase
MKVTSVTTSLMRVERQNWLFVHIDTDEGVSGVGEASLEGREQTVVAAIDEHARYLAGQDPTRISHHWQAMYRHGFWRGGVVLNTALSGLEQALWDIKGKALGVPVYELLGGRARDRIRVYTHCGGPTVEEAVERAQALVEQGYTALKFGSWPAGESDDRTAVRWAAHLIEAVRNAVGPDIDLMVDNHGRSAPGAAIELAHALAPYNLLFLEELTPPDNVRALDRVSASGANIRLATGERFFTKWGFRELLEQQLVDIVQPDICHDGGILETRSIAAMAEAYYVKVAPHNPNGPVATAASVQLAATIPNFLILEYAESEPYRSQVQRTGPRVENGYIPLPTGPGLGIELDDEVIAAHPYTPRDYPGVFDRDGAVADV